MFKLTEFIKLALQGTFKCFHKGEVRQIAILGFKYATLPQLLNQSQIISLHAPYNKHTHHMLDKAVFEQMQVGVTIINTSRGRLIDNEALVQVWTPKNISCRAGCFRR